MRIAALVLCFYAIPELAFAQQNEGAAGRERLPVYGELGLGFGQTLFFGDMQSQLTKAIGAADFTPNGGGNTVTAFYVAPKNWLGVGLGVRAKVFAAGGSAGPQGEDYFFNYYHVGASVKWFPLTGQFAQGPYVRASYGPGQFTAKRADETTNTFVHQFAVGSTVLGGIGYTLPVGKVGLSLEVEAESARRNGTVTGFADSQTFRSGQVGVNFIVSF